MSLRETRPVRRSVLLLVGERTQDAELVSLRVGHDHPRSVHLSDVDALRSEPLQPPNLDLLFAIRAEIEVNAILGCLLAVSRQQTKLSAGSVSCDKHVATRWPCRHMIEVESFAPERRHCVEVDTVDQDPFDGERHTAIFASTPKRPRGSIR